MKKRHLRTATVIGTIALTFGISMAASQNYPEKEITLEGKRPVPFSHQTHVDLGVSCGDCHHNDEHQPLSAEDIGAMDDTSKLECVNCHNEDFKNKELQEAKDIFHNNCRGCHAEGIDGKKGPMRCGECHVRKETRSRTIEGC